MKGPKPAYPQHVREAVLTAVLEGKRSIMAVVRDLNAGTLEGVAEPVPVSYSRARDWIRDEQARRAREEPLDRTVTRAAAERIWAIVGLELRKLERDAAKTKPADMKRARELFGMVRDVDAFLNRGKPGRPPKDPEQPEVAPDQEKPESLLERLARDQSSEPSAAAARPHSPREGTRQTATAQARETSQYRNTDGEMPSPVHSAAAQEQPMVA